MAVGTRVLTFLSLTCIAYGWRTGSSNQGAAVPNGYGNVEPANGGDNYVQTTTAGYGKAETQAYGKVESTVGYGKAETQAYGKIETTIGYGKAETQAYAKAAETTQGYAKAETAQGYGKAETTQGYAKAETQAYGKTETQAYAQPQTQGYAQTQAQDYAQTQAQAYAQTQTQGYAQTQPQQAYEASSTAGYGATVSSIGSSPSAQPPAGSWGMPAAASNSNELHFGHGEYEIKVITIRCLTKLPTPTAQLPYGPASTQASLPYGQTSTDDATTKTTDSVISSIPLCPPGTYQSP